jgi:phage tail-like protein
MKKGQIKRLLPSVYQSTARSGNPLFAILEVMEMLHAPCEQALDRLHENFDPNRAPDGFVPYLASWVDLEVLLDGSPKDSPSPTPSLSTGLGRLRELTRAAVTLSQWRGTRTGLCMFLEIATGAKGFVVDEEVRGADGKLKPFHVRVRVPGGLAEHRSLIERIVELEKPAYITYELEFALQREKSSGATT